MPVFLIQAKPHKTCVVRSGSTAGRAILASRVLFRSWSQCTVSKPDSTGISFLGESQVSIVEQNLRSVHPPVQKGVACHVSSRRHRTTSNLIWGKPCLEEQAEGVYDASGPPPVPKDGKDTYSVLPFGFTDNLNGGYL
jgi:hypothetical protein